MRRRLRNEQERLGAGALTFWPMAASSRVPQRLPFSSTATGMGLAPVGLNP